MIQGMKTIVTIFESILSQSVSNQQHLCKHLQQSGIELFSSSSKQNLYCKDLTNLFGRHLLSGFIFLESEIGKYYL